MGELTLFPAKDEIDDHQHNHCPQTSRHQDHQIRISGSRAAEEGEHHATNYRPDDPGQELLIKPMRSFRPVMMLANKPAMPPNTAKTEKLMSHSSLIFCYYYITLLWFFSSNRPTKLPYLEILCNVFGRSGLSQNPHRAKLEKAPAMRLSWDHLLPLFGLIDLISMHYVSAGVDSSWLVDQIDSDSD